MKARNGKTLFEDGTPRASLAVYPEFGLIRTQIQDDEVETREDEEVGEYIDKTEEDISEWGFKEDDDMYGSDDYSDVVQAIEDDGEDGFENW